MKTVCKKLFSLLLVAVLLISAVPFQASADTVKVGVAIKLDGSNVYQDKYDIPCGTVISTLLPSGATMLQEYMKKYGASSEGIEFQGWKFTTGVQSNQTVNTSAIISEDMADSGWVGIQAVFGYPTRNISLNANGGTVSTTAVAVTKGNVYPSLPTPTRDGYQFNGWHREVTKDRVDTGATVLNYENLVANWVVGSMPVVFQGWNGTDWVEVERRNPSTGKSLSDSGLGLPIQSTSYGVPRVGYTVNETNPWIDSKGNIFTANTVVNAVTYVRPNFEANTYTITYDFNCEELSDEKVQIKFGSTVTNLKQPTRANYVFQGWKVAHDGKEMKNGDTYLYGDITLVAQWAPKGTVELRIYRDDADGFMVRYYSAAVLGNELDLNNCKIQNYLSGTYDFDGWYDYNGWVAYLGTKNVKGVEAAADEITRISKVTTSNTANSTVTVIYGMVRNYKSNTTGSGSNNTGNSGNLNTKPADPTNPATGDTAMIEATVLVMTLSAAALVVMMQLRKRKMI